jgi:hypothetical protein
MAIASTKTSGRLRAGHKFIEGTLNLPLLEFNLVEEIRQQCQEDSWLRDIGRSSKTLVKHRELRIVLTSMKANTRMHQHKATARISIQNDHRPCTAPSAEADESAFQIATRTGKKMKRFLSLD